MAIQGKRRSGGEGGIDMPMNTLIDVVFLLLIYFILTWSPLVPEAHLTVNLPSPGQSQKDTQVTPVQIEVHPDKIKLQGNTMPIDDVRQNLQDIAELDPTMPVVIKVAKTSPTERLVQVLDMCKSVDFEMLNVVTLESGRGT